MGYRLRSSSSSEGNSSGDAAVSTAEDSCPCCDTKVQSTGYVDLEETETGDDMVVNGGWLLQQQQSSSTNSNEENVDDDIGDSTKKKTDGISMRYLLHKTLYSTSEPEVEQALVRLYNTISRSSKKRGAVLRLGGHIALLRCMENFSDSTIIQQKCLLLMMILTWSPVSAAAGDEPKENVTDGKQPRAVVVLHHQYSRCAVSQILGGKFLEDIVIQSISNHPQDDHVQIAGFGLLENLYYAADSNSSVSSPKDDNKKDKKSRDDDSSAADGYDEQTVSSLVKIIPIAVKLLHRLSIGKQYKDLLFNLVTLLYTWTKTQPSHVVGCPQRENSHQRLVKNVGQPQDESALGFCIVELVVSTRCCG